MDDPAPQRHVHRHADRLRLRRPEGRIAATPPPNACPTATAVAGATARGQPGRLPPSRRFKLILEGAQPARHHVAGRAHREPRWWPRPSRQPSSTSRRLRSRRPARGARDAAAEAKSTVGSSVHWTADDGVSGGNAGGGATEWGFDWTFGTEFEHDLAVGTRRQATRSRRRPSTPAASRARRRSSPSTSIATHPPRSPDFVGGYNTTRDVVDMRWGRYDERDLQGYRVVAPGRHGHLRTAGTAEACTDKNPPKLAGVPRPTITRLRGRLRRPQGGRLRQARRGRCEHALAPRTSAGRRPSAPTGLTASVRRRQADLNGLEPATVPSGRSASTASTATRARTSPTATTRPSRTPRTMSIPTPAPRPTHTYWVTAIDQNFNESPVFRVRSSPRRSHDRTLRREGGFTMIELLLVCVDLADHLRRLGDRVDRAATARTARSSASRTTPRPPASRSTGRPPAAQPREPDGQRGHDDRPRADYDFIFQTSDPSKTWVRYCLQDERRRHLALNNAKLWESESAGRDHGAMRRVPGHRLDAPTACSGRHQRGRRRRPQRLRVRVLGRSARHLPGVHRRVPEDRQRRPGASGSTPTGPTGVSELSVATSVFLRNQNEGADRDWPTSSKIAAAAA